MNRSTVVVLVLVCGACGKAPPPSGPITLEKIGHIGGPTGDGGFEGVTLLSPAFADGRRIAIVPELGSPRPVVWVEKNGTVTDTLATNGEGPGQVTNPVWAIRGVGDTAIVVDRGRIHFFAPDHHYVRSIITAFGGTWSADQGPDGTIVLASNSVGGRDEVVVGLSPVDGSRRWTIKGAAFDRERVAENRFVALAPDGSWWTARARGTYELQNYSSDGRLLKTVPMTAEWFPPYVRSTNLSRNSAPNTGLTGFWIDSMGRGWVIAQAADPDWASAVGDLQHSEGQDFFVPKHRNDVRDGIIEVIDLGTGKALATWRRDEVFGMAVEPGMMYEWRSSEDGWTQIDLYRVSLQLPVP